MKKISFYIVSLLIISSNLIAESNRPFLSDSIVVYKDINVSGNILLLDHYWHTDDTLNIIGTCEAPFDTIFLTALAIKQDDGSCKIFTYDSVKAGNLAWCGFIHIDGKMGNWSPLHTVKASICARDSTKYIISSDTSDTAIIDSLGNSDTIYSLTNDLLINTYCNDNTMIEPGGFWMNISGEIFPIYKSFSRRTGVNTYEDLIKYMNGYYEVAPQFYKYNYIGNPSYQCPWVNPEIKYYDYTHLNFYSRKIPNDTIPDDFRNVGKLAKWNGEGWDIIWSFIECWHGDTSITNCFTCDSLSTSEIESGIFFLFTPQAYLKNYIGYSECGGVRCHQIVPLTPWSFY